MWLITIALSGERKSAVDKIALAPIRQYEEQLIAIHSNDLIDWQVKNEELAAKKKKPVVLFSTSEVYGRPTGPTYREDQSELVMGPVTKQRWIYAASKQLLERVIHAYGLEGRLTYAILRPFNFL